MTAGMPPDDSKSLSNSMLKCSQFDPKEQISVTYFGVEANRVHR